MDGDLAEPPTESGHSSEPPGAEPVPSPVLNEPADTATEAPAAVVDVAERVSAPPAFWWVFSIGALCLIVFYAILNFPRYQIYRLLLESFVPLSLLILAVLGTIVFGLATPTEAAAIGALVACCWRSCTVS